MSSSLNPLAFGQTVTFTATVTWNGINSVLPTGTVQFAVDGSTFGTPAAVTAGQATITDAALNSRHAHHHGCLHRRHQLQRQRQHITAVHADNHQGRYSHDADDIGHPGELWQYLSSSPPPSHGMEPDIGAPTGTVTFTNNGSLLGTAVLSNGTASLKTTILPVGSDTIVATYGGDTNFMRRHFAHGHGSR